MSEYGFYTTPRACIRKDCGYETASRADYWTHRLAHEAEDAAQPASSIANSPAPSHEEETCSSRNHLTP